MDFQKHYRQQKRAEDSFRDLARLEFEESVWPEWLALIRQRIEEAKNMTFNTNNHEYIDTSHERFMQQADNHNTYNYV